MSILFGTDARQTMSFFINPEKQGRHIVDSQYYVEGRSVLTVNPELLIKLYACKGTPCIDKNGKPSNKEIFIHTEEIGIWKDIEGRQSVTNRGVIHHSNTGVHIVPARPNNIDL